ncbi:alpha/beta fold hydrolase [Arthrobacter bambusae]|uniref:alpha/beta fold hydrolase n=1 Tax=Arthrobacter bambusae TaxID=1338426 RepID=UPI00278A7454|nr:alpha/beta hydrolase [Arthrobacter bambusae]MDQ0028665.1 pimeloyl-ACP methyl ester carboxylesterase [Arthrobacter bambusae]MDQ0096541.1 pimeloyl-ACP methyl ester carboxylesterase [Arthrobacter bambusae]
MSRPVRIEVKAAGHLGHVFASRQPVGTGATGPAVVLLHGIGVSHRYLQRLHGLLALTVDTYSIDLPGFGGTPAPEHVLTAAEHATYVLGALEQLGVLEFVVVGHSMGTQFAVEAARQQPQRIPHVVLMGPVVNDQRRSVARQALALARDCLFFESPSSNAIVFTDYLRCGPGWYLKNLKVMMDYRIEARIGGVRAPVLVLRGAHDPVAPSEWCRRLVAGASTAQYLEISGTGHVVQHNRANEVADSILAFAGIAGTGRETTQEHTG